MSISTRNCGDTNFSSTLERTVVVSAGRRAVVSALEPEGRHTFRGRLAEVVRGVQTLHVHVVISGLHGLALQDELLLQVLHHLHLVITIEEDDEGDAAAE